MPLPHELNLRHLRAFQQVAAEGSISAASKRVHLSQPAITQAIGKLEQIFGTPLFARTNTGMIVTDAGRILAHRAARSLEHVRLGAQAAHGAGRGRRGRGFTAFDRLLTGAQLRALIAVAEAGNFSLAARTIGISQPSLHRLARDLERLAGVEFYRRTARGIDITPAAGELARHARLAFAELQQGSEEVDAIRGVDSARIHIGTLPLARTSLLPRAIDALSRQRPDVRIRVVDGPYDDLLHNLRHGEIDVLVGALRDPAPIGDVVQSPLFDDRLAVVARRGHPLLGRRRISVVDLARYRWIAPRPGPPGRARFDALFNGAGLAVPAGLIEASSLVLIRGLLLESDRLTLLSAQQVEPEIRHGMLDIVPFDLPGTTRPIGITLRRDWQPTATQALFLKLLAETCGTPTASAALEPAVARYTDFE